jgi:hypothetical protein
MHTTQVLVLITALLAAAPASRAQTAPPDTPAATLRETSETPAAASLDSIFVVHRVRQLSDTTALQYGRWQRMQTTSDTLGSIIPDSLPPLQTQLATFTRQEWPCWVERYQEYQIGVTLLNRDSMRRAAGAAPAWKKAKARRKKTALLPLAPGGRPLLGVGLAVVAVLSFAALGGRRTFPRFL